MATGTLARRFYVSGRVQGVGFRYFAESVASRLGVSGYVRNLPDGRVEVYAAGTAEQLASLAAELGCGPRMAWVDGVEELDTELKADRGDFFTIED